MRQYGIALLTFLLAFGSAGAAEKMGMVTGPATGTYIKFGEDIARVAAKKDVIMEIKESRGSIDNIKRISSAENASLGIVQSDVLGYLSRINDPELARIAERLRMIFPFYNEEVHLLAADSIRSAKDLNGKRVIVGPEGSGSWLTAMNIFAILDIKPGEIIRTAPAEGVADVLQGKADAVLFVGGKPVQLFKNLEEVGNLKEGGALLDKVHFVALNDPRLLQEYASAELKTADYAYISESVPTIAVTSALVSFDFSNAETAYGKKRCETVGNVVAAIRQNLDTLRTTGHPKWAEVNPDAEVKIWKKDGCAEMARTSAAASANNKLEKELLGIINKRD